MDLKRIGFILILAGLVCCLYFSNNFNYMISALTIVVFGFLITLFGYLDEVKINKAKNDRLDEDIPKIIQPLVTKYSELNKELLKTCDEEEYIQKRIQMNKALEKELGEKLPYLDKNEIRNIVIEVSHNQESM